MHAACSRNGNGRGTTPDTPSTNRPGLACAEPASSPANGAGGRDAQGRFAPGNAGGPGNPFARRTAELRREFLAEATGEDLRAVCRRLPGEGWQPNGRVVGATGSAGRQETGVTARGRPSANPAIWVRGESEMNG